MISITKGILERQTSRLDTITIELLKEKLIFQFLPIFTHFF